jgi:hypothetical protein
MKAHRVVRRQASYIFLDNRLTDGGEVVSLTRRLPFAPQEDSWYSFLLVIRFLVKILNGVSVVYIEQRFYVWVMCILKSLQMN